MSGFPTLALPLTLAHPVYNKEVKLPRWNCRTSILSSHCIQTSKQLIKRFAPGISKDVHAAIATYHQTRAEKLQRNWNLVFERACRETFDRPSEFTDYKIAAIGRAEFSEAHKRVLRHCAYRSGQHLHLAHVHKSVAGLK